MKTCTACKQIKRINQFAKAGKCGETQIYKSRCKSCTNEQNRADRQSHPRAHFENVVNERCPHGGGIRKFAFVGYRG